MQAKIRQITHHEDRAIKGEVIVDIHNGHSWHYDALTLICETQHEGARIALAICEAIDKLPDTPRWRLP